MTAALRLVGTAALLVALGATGARAQAPQPLTLQAAEQLALQNHPQILAAQYGSLAAKEVVRETRSAFFPTAFASLTGADAANASRVAAGGLNNPIIYDRFATGVTVGQLVTDFGRSRALVQSSTLNAQAREQGVVNQRASVLLAVDRAYFNVLRAQAVQRVAEQTVAARQLVADQVTALAASNLRSGLDVNFARVNLSGAQLLLIQAQNEREGAFADLATALGASRSTSYALVDEPLPPPPPPTSEPLVVEALRDRPDVSAERFSALASSKFADAERDLVLPSVSAVGAFGVTPYHQAGITDRYSAVGVNLNVPIMNGNLFSARHAEATLRAQAASENLRELENQVGRDVQVAWLNATTGFRRLDLTDQLLDQASQALDLAQARYNLGLSSIVELNQAQLYQTQAELEQASQRTQEYALLAATLNYEIGARK